MAGSEIIEYTSSRTKNSPGLTSAQQMIGWCMSIDREVERGRGRGQGELRYLGSG